MGDEKKGTGRSGRLRKVIRIVSRILLVLFVLAIALFLFMLGGRNEFFAPRFNVVDASAAADVIMRLSRSMVDRDSKPVETVKVRLKRHEVQMLVNTVIRNANASGREFLPYAALWDDGFLRVHCSMPAFGSRAVNLYLEITPFVENGKLSLIPGDGYAGRVPLPRFILRGVADRISRGIMRNETARTALSAFIRLEPREDGTILIMFSPRNVNAVVNLLRSARKPSEQELAAAAAPDDETETGGHDHPPSGDPEPASPAPDDETPPEAAETDPNPPLPSEESEDL